MRVEKFFYSPNNNHNPIKIQNEQKLHENFDFEIDPRNKPHASEQ